MIAGGCKFCGGTAGSATVPGEPQCHAICYFLSKRAMPTPKLGDVCTCCNGRGCHPRSATGPVNPNQDRVERWAPACRTCKGTGAINSESPQMLKERAAKERAVLHWYERCELEIESVS